MKASAMSAIRYVSVLAVALGVSWVLTTAAVAGPTAIPTPTATPTAAPTASPTAAPTRANRVCVSVSLPDLVGEVDFLPSTGGREASFDVGLGFSEIESVWIEVEAQVFAKEFDVCGTVFDPQPCVHVVQLLGFFAIMDKEDSPSLLTVFSDGLSFSDDFRALEGSGVDVVPFNNRLVGWDFLLDGQGSLTLFWNGAAGIPERRIRNVIQPSGEIFNARLIIEGTPIPGPPGFLKKWGSHAKDPTVLRSRRCAY